MTHVNSLKSIWEMTDSSYIQATKSKSGGRTPVCRRLFPEVGSESNRANKELQEAENGSGSESEVGSENSSNHKSFGDFDAIPEEFRPRKQGKGLMKVRTSPSKEKVDAEETPENERFLAKPKESQRKRDTRNVNSSTIQSETRNYEKELLKTDASEQRERDIGLTPDGTWKQAKSSGIFFYSYSARNESTSRATSGCQQNRSERENSRESSEKPKLKNVPDKNPYRRFYDSDKLSKATNEFDAHSSFGQHKEENNFNKNIPPKFQKRNLSNKDEINFSKCSKGISPRFQDRNAINQNEVPFSDKGAQKITREVTVEKRIKWKNDLCDFKKHDNKPNFFYKYTKTTKESVSCVSSHSEDDNEDDEVTKKPYQGFRRGRGFCKNFRRTDFGHNKQRPENQNDEGFDSTYKTQKNEAKHFYQKSPQKPANEENHNCFQCGNGKDPIVVRHEIKVIHVNRQGKNNRMHHNSSQPFLPPKKDRNAKLINSDTRERNGKIIRNDTKERNGKIINTDTRDPCSDQREKTTMTKTTEVLEKMKKFYKRPQPGWSSKTECAQYTVSRTSNGENAAALMKYGREISDLIAGSYIVITSFLDNYEQWKDIRRVTMLLFEEVEKNLSQSSNRNKRIIEVAGLVGTGCKMAQYTPHVGVSVAAKIIGFLSDVVARMFASSNSAKSIGMDDFQLRLCLQKDMDATTDIYVYGQQCDFQFQETRQLIEKFHGEIQDGRFEEFKETFETGFLKEISLLNPKHPEVFYKKLGRVYKLLNDHQQSEEGGAFCGAFGDWPDALTTVSRLHRRFKTENWDSSSVLKAWEEVYNLLQNDQSVVEDVLKKIQDCICVLIRERSVMEKYVMDLQRQG